MNEHEQTIVFRKVTNAGDDDYKEAMRIYTDSFPTNERQLPATIQQRIEAGKSTLIIVLMNEEVAAIILLFHLQNSRFLLLDYLAVKDTFRSAGVGSACMQHLKNYVQQQGKILVIEAEDPRLGNNAAQRSARINFYIKNGACILQDVPFILPALQGNVNTNMLLMIIGADKQMPLQGKVIQQLVQAIYFEVYERNNSDELLQSFINKIPATVYLNCNGFN